MTTTSTIPLPTTDADLIRMAGIKHPFNWDELGSSARDSWEHTQAASVRRSIDCEVRIRQFETAEQAWYWMYNERCEAERRYERRSGLCSSCGEPLNDGGDHDDDTEDAYDIAQAAHKNTGGIVVVQTIGDILPMAYVVSEQDGRWSASFGPY